MKNDVYQVVTDRIISMLEAGTVPWHQPWRGDQTPRNFLSKKAYRGINWFLLSAAGFTSPYWLTFKQIQERNGRVKKGERSFPVVFWKILEEEEHGETKKIPFLRYHSVFNVAQCEGINIPAPPEVVNGTFQRIEKCEEVVARMPRPPVIEYGEERAYYTALKDKVMMPKATLFESTEAYYSTLFHELTHSTGHRSRLSRKEIVNQSLFGSDPYSREELVAEMGAAFLCGHCGIENAILDQSASYIQNWLEQLKNDRKLVVHAAAHAQKAADFILDVKLEEEGPVEYQPKEFKVVALRECPTPDEMQLCDTPERAAQYWKMHIATSPQFNSECECFVVIMLNTRRRVKGHQMLSIGTMDTLLVHPREIFRAAIIAAASGVVLLHNHPSGDPEPSEADIKVTRDIIRAGQLLKMEVLDHIVIGNPNHCSLRSLGYFYS